MERKETVKRPSIDGNGAVFYKEQAIYFTLIDLKELIEKYGVQDIMKQMDDKTYNTLQDFYMAEWCLPLDLEELFKKGHQ